MLGIFKRALPRISILANRTLCKKAAPDASDQGPEKFKFNERNMERAKMIMSTFPEAEQRGALMALLDIAQRQYGWLPVTAIKEVSNMLKLDPFAVWEVATFYTMFNLKPVGKYCVSVCTTTPCYLRGSDDLLKTCKSMLNLKPGETSKDMQFTLKETYCMGACVNAPCLAVNDDLFEDVAQLDLEIILTDLKCGKIPTAGPKSGRCASEPMGGPTTLIHEPPPPGYMMQDLCK
ncbi:uncharacterized protein LOC115632956 [Scaptodrosophila lebanonensis]|uniref:Uncharacterized protein LOC115632956 n=1 Tax=Drosophila lebanonensis TaxID=7225 RepID=A0A6J2UD94_DROLE|nr:uncharacterized protein LOC115632956 [Scaptodrosophila lebanonensis]